MSKVTAMEYRFKGSYRIPETTLLIRVYFRQADFRAYYSLRDLMEAYNITENQAYTARKQGNIEPFIFTDGTEEIETVTNNQFQRIAFAVTGRNLVLPMTIDIPTLKTVTAV